MICVFRKKCKSEKNSLENFKKIELEMNLKEHKDAVTISSSSPAVNFTFYLTTSNSISITSSIFIALCLQLERSLFFSPACLCMNINQWLFYFFLSIRFLQLDDVYLTHDDETSFFSSSVVSLFVPFICQQEVN